MNMTLAEADEGNPIAAAVRQVAAAVTTLPPLKITVHSSIPIASGMGSGAAISAAIIRAITAFMNWPVSNKFISDMTYEVEKIHHGTPSGIDNTVVAYERPVYFVRQSSGNLIEKFVVKRPLHLLIADTGIEAYQTRVRAAREELRAAVSYQYAVLNDDLESAYRLVSSIIDAEAVRHARQPQLTARVAAVMDELDRQLVQLSTPV
jgi:mevalonate kinase